MILAPISRMVFGFPDGFLMTSIHPWRILYGSLPLATRLARAGEVRQPQLQKRHLGPEAHTQQRVTGRSGSRDGLDCACARFKVGSGAGKLEGIGSRG